MVDAGEWIMSAGSAIHEAFHHLGFDERYYNLSIPEPFEGFKKDVMTATQTPSFIHQTHFDDFAKYVLNSNIKQRTILHNIRLDNTRQQDAERKEKMNKER